MSFWRIERALLLAIISAKKSDRPTTQNLFQTYFLLVASVSKYFSHALACIRWFQYIFWLNGDLNNESYILQHLKVLNIKASHNLSLLPFFCSRLNYEWHAANVRWPLFTCKILKICKAASQSFCTEMSLAFLEYSFHETKSWKSENESKHLLWFPFRNNNFSIPNTKQLEDNLQIFNP